MVDIIFDRKIYFDAIRDDPFKGRLTQKQVEGQEFILDVWEMTRAEQDVRWLAYCLATTIHETASTMQPIEEYGKGKGHAYGKPHPETGETYYGRGFVQITWYENYLKMTTILRSMFPDKEIDLVQHPEEALNPIYAAAIMFEGMEQGLFRSGHMLSRYFSNTRDDAYTAREIINGDKTKVPSWSGGVNIGTLIAKYHTAFLRALVKARIEILPPDVVPPVEPGIIVVNIQAPPGIPISVWVNGEEVHDDGNTS
jgi:hypothetical protein